MKKLAYLASPYSDTDVRVRQVRYWRNREATAFLIQEFSLAVYSPILQNHPVAKHHKLRLGWDYWKESDIRILRVCDLFVTLTIPGHLESVGVKAETEIAAMLCLPMYDLVELTGGAEKSHKIVGPLRNEEDILK